MQKLTSFIVLIVVLLCGSAGASVAQDFDGFRAMAFPREQLAVGAKWFPGIGPQGAGAQPSNLVENRGLSSAVLNTTTKASILANLGTYLGLSGNLISTRTATFSNLSVTSVVDLTALDTIAAGEQYLAQAIRAGTIEIRTDVNGAAELAAKAEARGIPASVNVTGSNTRQVILNGTNLYVAYQVVELTGGAPRTRRVRHDGETITVDGTWRITFLNPNSRTDTVDVEVTNLRQPGPGGRFRSFSFPYSPQADWNREFELPAFRQGKFLTAGSIRVHYRPTCHDYSSPICVVIFPRDQNDVVVTTSRFEVRAVRSPVGL